MSPYMLAVVLCVIVPMLLQSRALTTTSRTAPPPRLGASRGVGRAAWSMCGTIGAVTMLMLAKPF